MPARERNGYKGGIGTFSYDLMVSMVGCFFIVLYLGVLSLISCVVKLRWKIDNLYVNKRWEQSRIKYVCDGG